jgi:very-short-patch-repair endonuclease
VSKNINYKNFIEKAVTIHDDKYDYSKTIIINSRTKIEIICPIHGSFFMLPHTHLNGSMCQKCSNLKKGQYKKLDNDIFVKKAIMKHGNKYDYSEIEYVNSNTMLKIICPMHGLFMQKAYVHLNGHGCSKCNNQSSFPEYFLLYYLKKTNLEVLHREKILGYELDIYIPSLKLGIEYDGYYYHKDKINQDTEKSINISKNNITLIRIREKGLCSINECFNFLRKNKKDSELYDIIIDILNFILLKYGERYDIDFDKESEYIKILNNYKNDNNENKNSNITFFPKLLNMWNYEKNIGLNPEWFSNLSHRKVWWICENAHESFSKIDNKYNSLIKGFNGCEQCNNKKYTTEIFIKKAVLKHGNKYDYSKVEYKTWDSNIIITCPLHGDFSQRAYAHLRGYKCKKCKNI